MEDPAGFFPTEGLSGVTAAKAGIQNVKAFDKTGRLPRAGMTRNPGRLPRAGMARGAIRLKCYSFSNTA